MGRPFVFDSGGKEALFLHEQQIPFEVVPGIPGDLGVPAYAGIPVTYPERRRHVELVRGHEDGNRRPPSVDWQRLAGLDGTLVCYAGARQIAGRSRVLLMSQGRAAEETAALIYAGTTPVAATIVGTLGDDRGAWRTSAGRRVARRRPRGRPCVRTCDGSTIGRCWGGGSSSPARASRPAN